MSPNLMGILFLLFLSVLAIASGILYFNKGEKAQEIKSLLKEILNDLQDLFSSINKLFSLLKSLVQEKEESSDTSKSELEIEVKQDVSPQELDSEIGPTAEPLIDEPQPEIPSRDLEATEDPGEPKADPKDE